MQVQIKKLTYWKTEHQTMEKCQDVLDVAPERGLFVIADGAGTTVYPTIWANVLVEHFMKIPLMSGNAFEIEWWLRQAQDEYKLRVPQIRQQDIQRSWNTIKKTAAEGSDSTLATLRIVDVTGSVAHASLLAFGDSCIIHGDPTTGKVHSFFLEDPAEFARGPICLSSELRFFKRNFHVCQMQDIDLHPQDMIIMATDAVAKWILSCGDHRYERVWDAFAFIYAIPSTAAWQTFIDACRVDKSMVDDDSTALILTICEDSIPDESRFALGCTVAHDVDTIKKRVSDFEQVQQADNKEQMALFYGDGIDLQRAGLVIAQEDIQQFRMVSDALRDVLRVLQQTRNTGDFRDQMMRVWSRNADVLRNELCAQNLIATLRNNSIPLDPHLMTDVPVARPVQPVEQQQVEHLQFQPIHPVPEKPFVPTVDDNDEYNRAILEGRHQKKTQWERDLYRAVLEEDEHELLSMAEQAEREGFVLRDLLRSNRAWEQYQRSLQRESSSKRLKQALAAGYLEEIVNARQLAEQDGIVSDINELQFVELACQLWRALQLNDDENIFKYYAMLNASDEYNGQIILNPKELERVQDAIKHQQALKVFRQAITPPGNTPQCIVDAYDPILDHSRQVKDQEWVILQLAHDFLRAYHRNDMAALIDIHADCHDKYPTVIIFTPEELARVNQAYRYRKELLTTVATFGNRVITLGDLAKFVDVRRRMFLAAIDDRQKYAPSDAEKQTIAELEKQANMLISNIILDELIDSWLISDEIAKKRQDGVEFNTLTANIALCYKGVNSYPSPPYEEFLAQKRLSNDDVGRYCELLVVKGVYAQYLSNRMQPSFIPGSAMTIEKWLLRHKKVVNVHYEESDLDMREQQFSNFGAHRIEQYTYDNVYKG